MVKTVQIKEKNVSTTYGNEDNISKRFNSPHFKDLECFNEPKPFSVLVTGKLKLQKAKCFISEINFRE